MVCEEKEECTELDKCNDDPSVEGVGTGCQSATFIFEESELVELAIIEEIKPVLTANFPLVKTYLETLLEKYKGIVVTEDSLDSCKAIQKKLSKLSKDMDDRRKEIKKEFSKPITDFEAECKVLQGLIDDVNAPIKEGIKSFDDIRRDSKKEEIFKVIAKFATQYELTSKYSEMLVVDESFLNITTTMKDITSKIVEKAMNLKKMQDNEIQALESIRTQIKSVNEMLELVTPLTEDDFKYLFTDEINVPNSIEAITAAGKSRKNSETTAVEKAKQNVPAPTTNLTPINPADVQRDKYGFDIWATEAEFESIKNFMSENKISFEEVNVD